MIRYKIMKPNCILHNYLAKQMCVLLVKKIIDIYLIHIPYMIHFKSDKEGRFICSHFFNYIFYSPLTTGRNLVNDSS